MTNNNKTLLQKIVCAGLKVVAILVVWCVVLMAMFKIGHVTIGYEKENTEINVSVEDQELINSHYEKL